MKMDRNYSYNDPYQGFFRRYVPLEDDSNLPQNNDQRGLGVVTRAGGRGASVVVPITPRRSTRISNNTVLREQIRREQDALRSQQVQLQKQTHQLEVQHEEIVNLRDDEPNVSQASKRPSDSVENHPENHPFLPDDENNEDDQREEIDEQARAVEDEEQRLEQAQQREQDAAEDRLRKAKRGPVSNVPKGYPFNETPKKVPQDIPEHFKGVGFETTLIGISNNNQFNTVDRLLEILLTKNDPKEDMLLERHLDAFYDSIIHVLTSLQAYYESRPKIDIKDVQFLLTINGSSIQNGMNLSQFSLATDPKYIANKAVGMLAMMVQSAKADAAMHEMFPHVKGPVRDKEIRVGKFFRVNILVLGKFGNLTALRRIGCVKHQYGELAMIGLH